ncbi:hypothetical protein BV25DRAFT_1813624 [Artomyces pyxidatus]|uniref:Uncharacterized protein n=1 Tax=Artomyces pyxidatus TaxID=48021 RepID=A0ACB8SKL5_9AGAM|nr:hypothetical protein BV25DRAFT_1813624 [Artomyces pyxidatus]
MAKGIVNGAEGYVDEVDYETDDEGVKHAKCVYVRFDDCGLALPGLPSDVVPIYPISKTFKYQGRDRRTFNITRLQIPLLPAYAYTDYKSQGRSLDRVVVDVAGCRSLQSLYVMLSRVKTLKGLAILRWFPPDKISQRLSHEFRSEFARLDVLHRKTREAYVAKRATP